MKALILSGGYGKRLQPITNNLPKCLVEINRKPILLHWLEKLSYIGIKEYLINTHYLHEEVEKFVNQYSDKYNIKLKYEKELLGTAGTLINNIDYFKNDDCLLVHCDNYSEDNLIEFKNEHKNRPHDCLLTMMLFETENLKDVGIAEINEFNILKNFYEKQPGVKGNLANAAIFILSNKFLDILHSENNNYYDFSRDVIKNFLNKIYTYKTNNFFMDIGTIENLRIINERNNSK